MHLLELTRDDPAENIALDDALVLAAEESDPQREILRIWEPASTMVVIGRASRIADEVQEPACQADAVPVLRRPSGGAAIVTGPGCLMYSLVLSYEKRPEIRLVDRAHRLVMDSAVAAFSLLVPEVTSQGICDLTVGSRKFAGHSVRCRREHLLYHGTILYDFPLQLIDRYLKMPPRVPAYRAGRPHRDFVTSLPAPREAIAAALIAAWGAYEPTAHWPAALTRQLVEEKYARAEWTRCR